MTQTVIVTGGSRGIGRAIALRLASDGFEVVINYASNATAAQGIRDEIEKNGHRARLMPCDVSDRAAVRTALEQELTEYGVPFGVVLNAGVLADAPFPAMEDDMWDRVVDVNLNGFYNVLKPLVMPMATARKGGRIVAMSSISGIAGNRGQVNYAATKAGIIGAAKSLSQELAKRKITVNVVAPGVIDTEMVDGLDKDRVMKAIPMRRYGAPGEVAGAVSFFMSPDASYVTGQVLGVNGGMI